MATRYLSSRGGSYDVSFEDVVLQGLADDGGLFIPQSIPTEFPKSWPESWTEWSFQKLAFEIFSLYISSAEIPTEDLKAIIDKSYSSSVFRDPEVTPVIALDEGKQLYLLELFWGPTFAFKDVALQAVGRFFEYFLTRRNKNKNGGEREHLTVVGATSGDTGSAAIYGLRGKKDVSIFIMHPYKKISPIQEAQMTSVLDKNVHNLAVDGDFDTCQDLLKALFADKDIKKTHKIGGVNSINWARILAQITYYFAAYSFLRKTQKIKQDEGIRFVVPTGNFGDVLAGYFAKRMGLPIDKLVIATNENDILHRFWQSGHYEKSPTHSEATNGQPPNSTGSVDLTVRETYSPAMDILVSSNFERLLWFLAYQVEEQGSDADKKVAAGRRVRKWLDDLKARGGFNVESEIWQAAKEEFETERVSDEETLKSIAETYQQIVPSSMVSSTQRDTASAINKNGYILDPHSAIGIEAAWRSLGRASRVPHVALATAHPAKFASSVQKALEKESAFKFEDILPDEFKGLEDRERRLHRLKREEGLEGLKRVIKERVPASQ